MLDPREGCSMDHDDDVRIGALRGDARIVLLGATAAA